VKAIHILAATLFGLAGFNVNANATIYGTGAIPSIITSGFLQHTSTSGSAFETLSVGNCAPGRIARITQRLTDGNGQPIPGSGSMIIIRGAYGPSLYLMSYQESPEVMSSRVNDPVAICLLSVPSHCPRGDTRGREFRVINLRTHEAWSMVNSEHSCGGA
jgi:hypothetical protein